MVYVEVIACLIVPTMSTERKTVVTGLLSYTAWGLFPIYWRFVEDLQAPELLAHRFIWSLFFYVAVFGWVVILPGKKWQLPTWRDVGLSALAATILGTNWLLFIYAVNSGRILESSLAYFLNPIMNVAVGVLFFRESIPWAMKLALGLAGLGIATQFFGQGEFPWIALTLATTFCAYGVVKKVTRVDSNLGLVLESGVMFLPAVAAACYFRQHSPVEHLDTRHWLLLLGTGVITGIPLVLFSYAAQRLPYSLLGVMQFVAPTLQFLVGWLLFNESLTPWRLFAFALVWAGVGFYLLDRVVRLRRSYLLAEPVRE